MTTRFKMPRKPVRTCCVPKCPSVETTKIMMLVPKDENRRSEWERAIGCTLKSTQVICEDHFVLENDAENWVKFRLMAGTKIQLNKTVVPYIFGHNNPQSQFTGYADRIEEGKRDRQRKKALHKQSKSKWKMKKNNIKNTTPGATQSQPASNLSSCSKNLRVSDTDLYEVCHLYEPEVTINEESSEEEEEEEEEIENFHYPLVVINEGSLQDGTFLGNSSLSSGILHAIEGAYHVGTNKKSGHKSKSNRKCNTINRGLGKRPVNPPKYRTVEVGSSGNSSPSYPSSPPTPVDDSEEDPEYNVQNERRVEESTDDEVDEIVKEEKRKPISYSKSKWQEVPSDQERIYICYWCNQMCKRRGLMKTHLYKKHSGEKPYACNKCDYRAVSRWILRDHKYVQHSGKRRFVCDICNQRYYTSGLLGAHKRHVHAEEKMYRCFVCDYRTNYRSKLNNHMLRHTGEKPYICVVCATRFRQSTALKAHMRIHTGEKPYACNLCDYRGRQSGMLTAHIRVHHPAKNDVS